jgi:hypothetical protein
MEIQEQKSIAERVAEKIKKGEVKMRPKIYFLLSRISVVLGIIFASVLVLYFVSFIFFSLRASGTMFLPRFGFGGLGHFLASLPWGLIFITGALVILLEILAKSFAFIYRRPVVYSLLALAIASIVGGFILGKTPFHSTLFMKAQRGDLPAAGPLYMHFAMPQNGDVFFGQVIETNEGSFVIQNPKNETTTVFFVHQDDHSGNFGKGDKVIILGRRENGKFQAFDVKKIKGNFDFFPPPPPGFPGIAP